jgi:hypothetical protein
LICLILGVLGANPVQAPTPPSGLPRGSLDRRPCFVRAAATRALPSGVRGPVDFPPCNLHRLRSLMAGFWRGVPLWVLARHLWPGQWGPRRVPRPASMSFFRSVKVNIIRPPCMRLGVKALYCGSFEGVTWFKRILRSRAGNSPYKGGLKHPFMAAQPTENIGFRRTPSPPTAPSFVRLDRLEAGRVGLSRGG